MKKIVIPTILAATILVAGMFAMMPVQKASTIHTSLAAQEVTTVFNADLLAAPADCTAVGSDFTVYANIANSAAALGTVTVDNDGVGPNTQVYDILADQNLVLIVSGDAGQTITFTGSAATIEGYLSVLTSSAATGVGCP